MKRTEHIEKFIREWLETEMGEDGYVHAAANGEYLADLCLGEDGEPSQAAPL